MSMGVAYCDKCKKFILATDHTDYCFGIDPEGNLQHTYWGKKLLWEEDYPDCHPLGQTVGIGKNLENPKNLSLWDDYYPLFVHLCYRVLADVDLIIRWAEADPWFALDPEGASTENAGQVWFGTLAWSGNWKIVVEYTSNQQMRVTAGINAKSRSRAGAYPDPEISGCLLGSGKQKQDFIPLRIPPARRGVGGGPAAGGRSSYREVVTKSNLSAII